MKNARLSDPNVGLTHGVTAPDCRRSHSQWASRGSPGISSETPGRTQSPPLHRPRGRMVVEKGKNMRIVTDATIQIIYGALAITQKSGTPWHHCRISPDPQTFMHRPPAQGSEERDTSASRKLLPPKLRTRTRPSESAGTRSGATGRCSGGRRPCGTRVE
jgi:hypothetical protein